MGVDTFVNVAHNVRNAVAALRQTNPDTLKQMLLILSRLALKHDLGVRALQAATRHTVLVKHDDPIVQASRVATGLVMTKSKEGHRPPGEPHAYGWALSLEDIGQSELTRNPPTKRLLEQVQEVLSEGGAMIARGAKEPRQMPDDL